MWDEKHFLSRSISNSIGRDKKENITTINLEVFTFRVEELYEQIPDKYNSYLTLDDFKEALIKNEINEIYLTRLDSLYSFLEHIRMYRDLSTIPRSENGVKVFCNRLGYSYSNKMDFKHLIERSTQESETYSYLNTHFMTFLAKVAEFVMTIRASCQVRDAFLRRALWISLRLRLWTRRR